MFFKYSSNNLYDCVGYSKVRDVYLSQKKVNGDFILDGQQEPIMSYSIKADGIKRYFVLSTFLGYIPTNKINSFKDLFILKNYLNDEIEWITPYNEEDLDNKSIKNEEVKRLSRSLGKHWKNK